MNTKTFRVWPGFYFSADSRFCIEARARTKGVRHFAQTPFVAEVPRSSSPRHGPNLIGSVPEAGEPNSITVENRSHEYAQNSTFRTLARATKLFRDSLGGPRLDRVIGLKQHIRFDEQAAVSQFIANKIDFQGSERRSAYAAEVVNSIGSTIEGSSFSGLLTRVEIGHIRMGAAGNGRIKSPGSGSSLSQRA